MICAEKFAASSISKNFSNFTLCKSKSVEYISVITINLSVQFESLFKGEELPQRPSTHMNFLFILIRVRS